MEAKRIIDSQLAFAPSCEELSRMVHLSLTKLTRGFSSFYGMPIHQYVIEQRLAQAAQLLLEGDWNVSEVAAIVGYGKASNFAAAFKKRYGVAPKNYREDVYKRQALCHAAQALRIPSVLSRMGRGFACLLYTSRWV